MSTYTVIGIDPASSKDSTLFDGHHFESLTLGQLESKVKASPDVLLCWDAPLTGPPMQEGTRYQGDLCTRVIEKYFGGGQVRWHTGSPKRWRPQTWRDTSKKQRPFLKVPPGISVRGFAGLTHWTISRRVLGLPRVGPFDLPLDALPARLLTEETVAAPAPDPSRPSVVEVHPALALWLWLRVSGRKEWLYKKKAGVLQGVWAELQVVLSEQASHIEPLMQGMGAARSAGAQFTDDHLDAFVAWALGTIWTHQSAEEPLVVLFGDRQVGAMLVPRCDLTMVDLAAEFRARRAGRASSP